MFLALTTLLTIIQLISAEDTTESAASAETTYDNGLLQEILQRMILLQTTHETLRQKMDSQHSIMERQYIKHQNEFKKDMDQQFSRQYNEFKKDVDQQKDEFEKGIEQQFDKQHDEFKKFVEQQNEYKKDMEQQFLRQYNESKKEADQQKTEFKRDMEEKFEKQQIELQKGMDQQNEYKKDMDQQFTKQQNDFKKGFEDLQLAFAALGANLTDARTNFTNQPQEIDQNKSTSTRQSCPANCVEALGKSGRNGTYKIEIPNSELEPFYVYCLSHVGSESEENTQALNSSTAAWMVVQRRLNGSIDFNRNWTDYQNGFGNLESEFFIGLDKLHALTLAVFHELWIQMEDFEGSKRWAKYSSFAIGGKNEGYILNVLGAYTGDAGDSLAVHAGQKWTTKDVDNSNNVGMENCAITYGGAWWFEACHDSNLNGEYLRGEYPNDLSGKGVIWRTWHGNRYSLKSVFMAIRPVQ